MAEGHKSFVSVLEGARRPASSFTPVVDGPTSPTLPTRTLTHTLKTLLDEEGSIAAIDNVRSSNLELSCDENGECDEYDSPIDGHRFDVFATSGIFSLRLEFLFLVHFECKFYQVSGYIRRW